MKATVRPHIKICCISSMEEAWQAIEAGASAVGLVSEMPSGPGVITEHEIARITAAMPPGIGTFLLTSLQDSAAIIAQQRRTGVNTIQIVDSLVRGYYTDFREQIPGIKIVQVIHVTGPESIPQAIDIASHVDALLLDSGNPNLAVKELGGTGRRHDWSLSRTIREQIDIPLYLAGGLTADNVASAIEQVGSFGLDLCSHVRTEGKLDTEKLHRFFSNVSLPTSPQSE